MSARYLYAVLHEISPRPGETLEEAWNRCNSESATDEERGLPIFATGVLDATSLIPGCTFDIEVIADDPSGRLASSTVLPVTDEEIVPLPSEGETLPEITTDYAALCVGSTRDNSRYVRRDGAIIGAVVRAHDGTWTAYSAAQLLGMTSALARGVATMDAAVSIVAAPPNPDAGLPERERTYTDLA